MRELLPSEMDLVSGGLTFDSGEFSAGVAVVALGIGIVATGGLAGAGALAAFSLIGGTGVVLSAGGGAMMGDSVRIFSDQ